MLKRQYHPAHEKTPITEAINLITGFALYQATAPIRYIGQKITNGIIRITSPRETFPESSQLEKTATQNTYTTNGFTPLSKKRFVDNETNQIYDETGKRIH